MSQAKIYSPIAYPRGREIHSAKCGSYLGGRIGQHSEPEKDDFIITANVLTACSAYRIVSIRAMCAIAGMIPSDLLTNEAYCLYWRRRVNQAEVTAASKNPLGRT